MGDLMLRVDDAWAQAEVRERARARQAELGRCLSPAHQGQQGYAVEAVRELVTVAFELGVRRVVALCFADNVASRRGMVGWVWQEGHYVGDSLHRDGTWRDGMSFALLAEEWRARP